MKIKNIKELFKRRYTLMDLGVEIVAHSVSDGKLKRKPMYLVFEKKQERDYLYD